MKENVIYISHNINILELLYNILIKYDYKKENRISCYFDIDYINYYSQYYLDSKNELTKYNIEPEPPYEFEGYEKEINRDFNLDDYVRSKYNYLVKILNFFNITCGEFKKYIYQGEYTTDNEGDEVIIEPYQEIYYFVIEINKEDLKLKILNYINNEIIKKDFDYSIEKIEEAILKQFEVRGKDKIKISNKKLSYIIGYNNKKHFKNGNDDGITIVYYNDVLELFLMKLYLDGNIYNFGNPIKGNIEKINNRFGNETIIKLSNDITYNKTKKIIYNKSEPIILNGKSSNHILIEILLDNIGMDFDLIKDIEKKYKDKVKSKSEKSISEQISQTFYKLTNKKSKLKFLEEVIQGKKIIKKI